MDSNLRLVIADADSNYRAMLCEAAREAEGISLVGDAGSGAEVLRLLEQKSADVLLLDLILPDGDGIYVMDTLRKSGVQLRFVVNSGFMSALTCRECNQFHVSSFVMKPNSPDLLFGRVRSVYQSECGKQPEPPADQSDFRAVTDVLIGIGFPSRFVGYVYLREVLLKTMAGADARRCLTTVIYREIGAKHGTSWKNIERDVRTAIDAFWANGGDRSLYDFLGVRLSDRPTARTLIRLLTDYLCFHDERRLG